MIVCEQCNLVFRRGEKSCPYCGSQLMIDQRRYSKAFLDAREHREYYGSTVPWTIWNFPSTVQSVLHLGHPCRLAGTGKHADGTPMRKMIKSAPRGRQ